MYQKYPGGTVNAGSKIIASTSMFSAKALFLKLQFASLLSELARRAAERSAAVAASSAFDVVAASNSGSLPHLTEMVSILYNLGRGKINPPGGSTQIHTKRRHRESCSLSCSIHRHPQGPGILWCSGVHNGA